ncbi:MAG: riboflavin kinase / adenylyltransferase, partial [Chthoniobacter sp.]|nr:riboflavin kinase / adenylyltransferase [Chthoniobacter sp.]
MNPAPVFHAIAELAGVPGPIFLAIGVFDGVHLGHRAVIERALADAARENGRAIVVTFDPHPSRVLRPDKAPRLLTATRHKLQLIRALGVDHLLVLPFTREFAATPPRKFVTELFGACHRLREICVGHEWSFGHDRAGNLQMLAQLGDELGFDEVGVPAVRIDGKVVSSTLIRAAIEAGDFETARRFLGRDYTVLGTVVRGDGLGRQLGFPTANLSAHNEQFPPDGVYVVEAKLGTSELPGVVNIGVRPTIAGATGNRTLELHLLDFTEDIYGEDVEISFSRFLRPEHKFDGLAELKAQLAQDVAAARSSAQH